MDAAWTAAAVPGKLVSSVFDWTKLEIKPNKTGERRDVVNSPTNTLASFECHVTTLKPVSGTITTTVDAKVVTSDGTVIYSHKTNAPLIENVACGNRRRGPVSGNLVTVYRTDTVQVDFGDGTCTNKTITITFNGVTTTKTIGE